jgi:hypothetical protein
MEKQELIKALKCQSDRVRSEWGYCLTWALMVESIKHLEADQPPSNVIRATYPSTQSGVSTIVRKSGACSDINTNRGG